MKEQLKASDESSAADATRAEILRHAADLFQHYGYGKTNIGDIAKRVGMSPGNLYRYFKNKQAIGEETVRCYMCEAEDAMAEALRDPKADYEAKLRNMMHRGIGGLISELRQNPKMVELADMICEGESGILRRHLEWKLSQFERLIREGVEQGALKVEDPVAAAVILLDATKAFWMPPALTQMDFDAVPRRLDGVLDMMLAGMRA